MKNKRYKPTLLIDLDGVLNTYNGNYTENYIPPIKDEAIDFITKIHKKYKLVLFTTRNQNLTERWLQDNRIDKYFDQITNTKIPAFLIIDDRCICFNGNYNELIDNINSFTVWHKL